LELKKSRAKTQRRKEEEKRKKKRLRITTRVVSPKSSVSLLFFFAPLRLCARLLLRVFARDTADCAGLSENSEDSAEPGRSLTRDGKRDAGQLVGGMAR
jgi:hypothetical protein